MLHAETASAMAHAAYRQAAKLSSFGTDVVGVGCTCALATDREKRGEHKAFITTYNGLQERRSARQGGALLRCVLVTQGCVWVCVWGWGGWGGTASLLWADSNVSSQGLRWGGGVAGRDSRMPPPLKRQCSMGSGCVGAAWAPLPLPPGHACPLAHPPARSFSLLLAKGARSRLGEDTLVSKLLIRAVAESMGLSAQVCVCVGGGGLGVERRAALRLHKHATLDVGAAWPVPFAACQTATHNALAARAVLASAC
jgi:hypothetical protein